MRKSSSIQHALDNLGPVYGLWSSDLHRTPAQRDGSVQVVEEFGRCGVYEQTLAAQAEWPNVTDHRSPCGKIFI
jgi:hypothetical protein